MRDSTERFSSRVENYVKYRPHYPQEMIQILRDECRLTPEWRVADIGSGTGFSCEPFLKNGNPTIGVEPNTPMREAAESFLQQYPNFTSVAGSAEETTLADASVEMIAAGQTFHWFDRSRAKVEFKRILKPGGWIVVFWNCRIQDSPYQDAYVQALRRHSPEYEQVKHENTDDSEIRQFFEPGGYSVYTLENSQVFDFEGLKGRLLSCSYAPEYGQPEYGPMLSELRTIFDMYQQDGQIIMEYDLRLYIGKAR